MAVQNNWFIHPAYITCDLVPCFQLPGIHAITIFILEVLFGSPSTPGEWGVLTVKWSKCIIYVNLESCSGHCSADLWWICHIRGRGSCDTDLMSEMMAFFAFAFEWVISCQLWWKTTVRTGHQKIRFLNFDFFQVKLYKLTGKIR